MHKTAKTFLMFFLFLAFLLTIFTVNFFYDNKYSMPMPLPQDGILHLNQEDLLQKRPIFLIDAWQFCDGALTPQNFNAAAAKQTYIGEFSTYRKQDPTRSPLGSGTYQMRFYYEGNPIISSLVFPELFTDYTLWWDEEPIAEGRGRAQTSLLLTEGEHTLTVAVTATKGYYAGMYFPGAIGSESSLRNIERIQTVLYAFAILAPLVLTLFCFGLWKKTQNRLLWNFACLCLSFSLYMSHYFVQLWALPFSAHFYFIEDTALYALLYFAVCLSLEASDLSQKRYSRILRFSVLFVSAAELLLYFLTPIWNDAVLLHGILQNGYRLFIFFNLILLSLRIQKQQNREYVFILCANGSLGVGLFINLMHSNLFEPIYTFWQFEWCVLFMVLLFAAMMIAQNQRILAENRTYQSHLEEMVKERTHQMSCLLDERRAFFSDMAHDLKAPLHATDTFIQMIRQHAVGLDSELSFYLDLVEKKQQDMANRLKSLSTLNEVDRLTSDAELIDAASFLEEVYQRHSPEANVSGIHLKFELPSEKLTVLAQKEKLLLAFENLIYNALRFTPMDGSITLTVKSNKSKVCFTVADTGCGIPSDELPHVFERFYMGKNSGPHASGLGLYIVKSIAEEAGGTVKAESPSGKGASFTLCLPRKLTS